MSRPMVTLTVAEAQQLLDGFTAVKEQLSSLLEEKPAWADLRDAMEELQGYTEFFYSIARESVKDQL